MNSWAEQPRSRADISRDLTNINQQLASDWERIRHGGEYDVEKRASLFTKKRKLLNELTHILNPELPAINVDAKSLRSSAPLHESQRPLIARALNTYHRIQMTTAETNAAEIARKLRVTINDFTMTLLTSFSLHYAELRANFADNITRDDPLVVSDGTIYLSYFFDDDEAKWRVQVGVATTDGVSWGSYPVETMYELGAEVERTITEGGVNVPYHHEKE